MAGTDEDIKQEEAAPKEEETKTATEEESKAEEKEPENDDEDKKEGEDAKEDDDKKGGEEAKASEPAEEAAAEPAPEAAAEDKAEEPTAAVAADAPPTTPAAKKDDGDEDNHLDSANKRRFFPRVKHLLTREWAYFLSGVLDALELSHACTTAAASHKAVNAWYRAFDLVYGGIAAECSIPTGKNRYHKFKDKIVELWTAMESQAPDDHPLKARAIEQFDKYRKACQEQQLQVIKRDDSKIPITPLKMPADKANLPPGAGSAAALGRAAAFPSTGSATKRSYASMMPNAGMKWKHMDEAESIKKLPEPLQSLLHLRHLGSEMKAKSTVEIAFQKALDQYLKQECDKDGLYDKTLCLATLYRQAQSAKELREILAAYDAAVSEYLTHIDPSAVTV